eukprot:CAMPEP_0117584596 /NCGR_PEP_ID=MMETSP0784-20121206/67689_1 /TAXON_ID=39447 /ORGANISM="" /LENGTH=510 /DNA_ID=CAMNT_0005385473 /DNA_START=54 /DNA_END=1583 /DNA_ORIENTATION=-
MDVISPGRRRQTPVTGQAVLLSKHDLDRFRGKTISPSKGLPRCHVVLATATPQLPPPHGGGFAGAPSSRDSARPKARGGGSGDLRSRGQHPSWPPPPQRRTRSASSRRLEELPPSPRFPDALEAGVAGRPSGAAQASRATRARRIASCVKMDIAGPEPKPMPAYGRASSSSSNARAGGNALAAAAAATPLAPRLELCGYDPRRAPPPPMPRYIGEDAVAAQGRPGNMSSQVADALRGLGLAISGQAATVTSHQVAAAEDVGTAASPGDGKIEAWTSSEDEGADDASDGEGEEFYYRKYRFQDSQARALPPEPSRRRLPRRAPVAARPPSSLRDDDASDTEGPSPWRVFHEEREPWASQSAGGAVSSRSPTPFGEEELGRDEQLRRAAEVLVRFYGLPGGTDQAVRFKHSAVNVVMVEEEAWEKRQRPSQLEMPPMLWIRGNRVYDFHGDRGTLAEFEHDLLTRQVEDDATCRTRRREQGLMPFPFVALPLKQSGEEPPDEQFDAREGRRG